MGAAGTGQAGDVTASAEIAAADARVGATSGWWSRWPLLVGGLVIAVLMAPMVLTNSTFGYDWPDHLWLVQMQARNISSLGHPSLFLQSSYGAFEPWYAFYGGTLYSLVAAGSVLSGGHTLAAYIASFALAMAMAYGGFVWLARQAGLRGIAAQGSAVVYVTSTYYLTDVYARGAWPETVATSAIPLVIASALALLRDETVRPWPALAFVVSVVLLSGSHNITLLYGTVFLALLAASVAVAVGRSALPSLRRVAAVGLLAVLAVAVNLWFLLPDIAFQGKVTISHTFTKPPAITGGTPPWMVFDPVRHPWHPGGPTFDLQLPVFALLWSLTVLAVTWRGLAPVWRRLAIALAVTSVPFLALLFVPPLWHVVPHLFWSIQFPYRLLSYVGYCIAALVTVALIALTTQRPRATRALVLLAILFAAIDGAQAINQEWSGPSSLPSRSAVFPGGSTAPEYWVRTSTYLGYQDVSLPVVNATIPAIPGLTVYNGQGANVLPVPVTGSPRTAYAVSFTPPASGTVTTDVVSGPYLVAVHGGSFVGRTPYSELILHVDKQPSGPTRVVFSTARTWPIVVGEWGSVAAVLVLAALLLALAIRRLRVH